MTPCRLLTKEAKEFIRWSNHAGTASLIGSAFQQGFPASTHRSDSSPKSVIAKNTTDAMDSGMIYGTASMIDGMIDRIQEEMGRELAVVATGGLAKKCSSILQTQNHA